LDRSSEQSIFCTRLPVQALGLWFEFLSEGNLVKNSNCDINSSAWVKTLHSWPAVLSSSYDRWKIFIIEKNKQVPLMQGIEQILRYRCPLKSACIGRLLPGTSQTWCWGPSTPSPAGPGRTTWSYRLSRILSVPEVRFVHTRKFFRSSYDLFLQALLLLFNRSVKRLAKLKSNEYNGLSGNRGTL
jgi:hypothetical protein